MAANKAQPFGTVFLVLAALAVILLNVALVSDLHAYSKPACVSGEELGAAGVIIDVSQGEPAGLCNTN